MGLDITSSPNDQVLGYDWAKPESGARFKLIPLDATVRLTSPTPQALSAS